MRAVDDAAALLDAGADKVSVNSAALARPELIGELAGRLGSQAVVTAIDAAGGEVYSHAGTRPTGRRASEWAREAEEQGAGEILLTSIDADGTREGYDLPLTTRGRGRGLDSGHRVGRGGECPPRGGGARGRAGCPARLDPPREPRPAVLLRSELRELGVPRARCSLSFEPRSSRTRAMVAC